MNDLKPNAKASRNRKRVCRGIGSGWGKTGGRGYNGQKSRSGASIPAWFEGGQNPLYRRIPKRGFTNIFAEDFNVINIEVLDRIIATSQKKDIVSAAELNSKSFEALGLLKVRNAAIKIIGGGSSDLKVENLKGKKLIVNAISGKCKEATAKLGIDVEIVEFLAKRKRVEKPTKQGA